MNRTEYSQVVRLSGRFPDSDESIEDMDSGGLSQQDIIRERTQRFVQKHWNVLQYSLKCSGNCASPENSCPNARAVTCYYLNKSEIDS